MISDSHPLANEHPAWKQMANAEFWQASILGETMRAAHHMQCRAGGSQEQRYEQGIMHGASGFLSIIPKKPDQNGWRTLFTRVAIYFPICILPEVIKKLPNAEQILQEIVINRAESPLYC